MKQVDHTEWELLKRTAAAHLESPFWHSGAFCVTPAEPPRPPEIWVAQLSPRPLHLAR